MIVGFLCNNKKISFDDCLNCADTPSSTCEFNKPLLRAMVEEIKEEKEKITATSILGCARRNYLYYVDDVYIKPEEMYWRFRGQMFHYILQNHKTEDVIKEQRFYVQLDDVLISGKIDAYIKSSKVLYDYKSTDKIPKYNKAYDNHGDQVNIYRWLLHHNGYEVNKMFILYMDMMNVKKIAVSPTPIDIIQESIYRNAKRLDRSFKENLVPPAIYGILCSYCYVSEKCAEIEKELLVMDIYKGLKINGDIEDKVRRVLKTRIDEKRFKIIEMLKKAKRE